MNMDKIEKDKKEKIKSKIYWIEELRKANEKFKEKKISVARYMAIRKSVEAFQKMSFTDGLFGGDEDNLLNHEVESLKKIKPKKDKE